ncbi:CopZ coatomer protein complex, subunit zeta 1 [Ostreococcus tauri]|uniref:Coatomer subunit zeta n=1 Tax=Ostreococcus tauri TaxID=70448 RepID=A0A1Y5HWW6_OSTTA|nr:CopZ coatomer protein complex, subunit zeta 1 [Ostreococcus tauri]
MPSIASLIVLDGEGKRLAAKYYDPAWRDFHKQVEFERAIFQKTNLSSTSQELDVLVLEQHLVVYRSSIDFQVYAVASKHENEVIVAAVLQALFGALSSLTNGLMEKHTLLEHFDECMLVFDELVDGGFILETDPDVVCHRVAMLDSPTELGSTDHPLSQAFASAKEISRNLLR